MTGQGIKGGSDDGDGLWAPTGAAIAINPTAIQMWRRIRPSLC